VDHSRKLKKTCLALSKVLKQKVSRDNSQLLKAKEELIKIAKGVIASGQGVKTQLDILKEKPIEATRLGKQLGERKREQLFGQRENMPGIRNPLSFQEELVKGG